MGMKSTPASTDYGCTAMHPASDSNIDVTGVSMCFCCSHIRIGNIHSSIPGDPSIGHDGHLDQVSAQQIVLLPQM